MNDQTITNKTLVSGTLGAETAMPVSPLQSVINEQGEQIEKLTGLLDNLTGRLHPVCNSVPREDSTVGQQLSPAGSPMATQIIIQTNQVKFLQTAVSALLEGLEV